MRKLTWQWSTLSSVCQSWNLESFAENSSNSSQIRSKGWSALGEERHRFWGRYVAPLSDWIIWFKVIRIARFVQGLGCPGDTHTHTDTHYCFCLSSILTLRICALPEEHTMRSAINTCQKHLFLQADNAKNLRQIRKCRAKCRAESTSLVLPKKEQ